MKLAVKRPLTVGPMAGVDSCNQGPLPHHETDLAFWDLPK